MKMGRPSKLTDALMKKFCALLEKGHSLHGAAALCDVDVSTVMRWRKDGQEQESGKHREFYDRSTRARHKGAALLEGELLDHYRSCDPSMMNAGTSSGIKILKLQYPEIYQERHVIAGDPDQPVEHKHSGKVEATLVDADQALEIAAILRESGAFSDGDD